MERMTRPSSERGGTRPRLLPMVSGRARQRVTPFVMLPVLVACGDGGTGPEKNRIGSEGGIVTFVGGAVTLTVPPDALSDFVEFTATPTSGVPSSNLLVPGSTFELGPAGTFFAQPATLTLGYNSAGLPEGVVESELRLHKATGSNWASTTNASVDTNKNTVSGSIQSLGRFGALGVSVFSVDVSPVFYALGAGERKQLGAVAKGPSGELLASRKVTWVSSDEAVATVDSLGWVTGVGFGSVTISAHVEDRVGVVTLEVYDCEAQSEIPPTECHGLVSVYDALTEWGWRYSRNWVAGPDPCDWRGVTCEDGSVSEFFILAQPLPGTIPTSIGDLTNLKHLRLAYGLTGSIPSAIGSLSKLETLTLNSNDLSGPIPPSIGQLTKLRELVLFSNDLTGPLPTELGNHPNLTHLRLNSNRLSGPIPPAMGGLSSLIELTLLDNQFSGSIPKELGGLTKLERLSLGMNELSGGIPRELGGLSNLTLFGIRDNQLTGSIPQEIGNLLSLTLLSLEGNQLAGSIPLSVAQLGGMIQATHSALDCRFVSPGNDGLSIPDTQEFRDADQDGDGKICFLTIGSD